MDPQVLAQIEQACYVVYNPSSATSPAFSTSPHHSIASQSQSEALQILAVHFPSFSDSASPLSASSHPSSSSSPLDAVFACQFVLEHSSSPYAQLYAASHLKTITVTHFTLLNNTQKLDLRSFVLDYLYRHPTVGNVVVSTISSVFSLLTKFAWFDDDQFKAVLPDLSNFFEATNDHQLVGLCLLGDLIAEMNMQSPQYSRSRKTATNFKDLALLPCFQLTVQMLSKISTKQIVCATKAKLDTMVDLTLKAMRNCLQYDFLGVNPDESSEDIGSTQFPTTWKDTIIDPILLQTIYDAYALFQPPHSNMVLECLSMIVAVRRTLLSNSEKQKFVPWVLQAMTQIMKTGCGLMESINVHEFCRLLSKFKWVNQTSELLEMKEVYKEWIQYVAKFTKEVVFAPDKFAKHSVIYMVTFWKEMIASAPSGARSGDWDHLLDLSAQITQAFVNSRIGIDGPGQMDDDTSTDEELFENEDGSLSIILEHVARIARTKYEDFRSYIKLAFEVMGTYHSKEGMKYSAILEVKFTWIVYLIGAVIGARPPSSSSSNDADIIDGELACTVLQLMQVYQSFQSQHGVQVRSKNLDLAFLHFFSMFRKTYIGSESTPSGMKVYGPLGDMFGLSEQKLVMDMFMQQLANNLRTWNESPAIVEKSLALFDELASGYSSVKLIRKTETVNFILSYHTANNFPFLNHSANIKQRTIYYSVLGKLLVTNDETLELEFLQFVSPFTEHLNRLMTINDPQLFRREEVRSLLDAVFRDLRGLLLAFNQQPSYSVFFSWFYPYCTVLLKGVEANYDHPVSNTILKFMCVFVEDRCFRISKEINDSFSPNGILLFRETSKLLAAYGRSALTKVVPEGNKWSEKYKGISYCYKIMGNCLDGKYCNFGIFELFNDPALKDALSTCFQIMINVPMDDMLAFPKLSESFFFFLKTTIKLLQNRFLLVDEHLKDPNVFGYIVRILGESLKLSVSQMGLGGVGVGSQESLFNVSCEISDLFASFIFKHSQTKQQMMGIGKPQSVVVKLASEYPQLMQFLLAKILDIVFFDDRASQYTLSKPLLPMILLNKEYFDFYVNKMISCQLPERQEPLAKALNTLMANIEGNLSRPNRDVFATRLTAFKRERESQMLSLIAPREEEILMKEVRI